MRSRSLVVMGALLCAPALAWGEPPTVDPRDQRLFDHLDQVGLHRAQPGQKVVQVATLQGFG